MPDSHTFPLHLKTSRHLELYDNMLPKDLNYYRHVKMPKDHQYVVGLYNYLGDIKNGCLFFTQLLFLDFDTLSGNHWINNFVIDICLATKVHKLELKNIKVLQC